MLLSRRKTLHLDNSPDVRECNRANKKLSLVKKLSFFVCEAQKQNFVCAWCSLLAEPDNRLPPETCRAD